MNRLKSMLLAGVLLIFMPAIGSAGSPSELTAGTATVAEVIAAGGYTYLRLNEPDVWIATNTFSVADGDTVNYSGGMEMQNFHSKALDRTFPSIYFVRSAALANMAEGDKSAVAENPHGALPMRVPAHGAVAAPAAGEIAPLADGKVIAGIYTDSSQLKGKKVSLNAKVIKISQHIMGKNWITLQDGTGTKPDDKLMATSTETVSPGDVVTASGILNTDVDIGSGYKYKILLEETSFTTAKNAP